MFITEGLAEIKTLNARIEKKRQGVSQYVLRDSRLKDPMADEGGVVQWVEQELQAIGDLERRIVKIRTAIQTKNLYTSLQVGEFVRSVQEWLNWRREIAEGRKNFLRALTNGIANARKEAAKMQPAPDGSKVDIEVHISEKDLAAQVEEMETILGELDGKLSLLNATTKIEVA